MKTILVPTDFTEQAERAFAFACELAKKSHGSVYLLHVAELPVVADPMGTNLHTFLSPEVLQSMEEHIMSRLTEFSKKCKGAIPVQIKMDWGNPFAGIYRSIEDLQVDLVVMGSKGATGAKEIFIGSNAEKVVRNSRVPVITIKEEIHVDNIKSIVLGTDIGGKPDIDLFFKVKELAQFFGARLHLLRVNTPTNFWKDHEVYKKLMGIAHEYLPESTEVHIFNDVTEDLGLLHFAEHINADMIAIGTHGRRGLGHFINGSIAEDIVNHAKRPIWTSVIGRK